MGLLARNREIPTTRLNGKIPLYILPFACRIGNVTFGSRPAFAFLALPTSERTVTYEAICIT